MAYIDAATTKKIRESLKAKFPEIKFGVSKKDNISLHVTIKQSPYFDNGINSEVNKYWFQNHYEGKQRKILEGIIKTIKETGKYYDNSDIQSDYFDTAFYYGVHIGSWDKPHVKV